MLIPKRTKYRKQHRPVRRGMSKGGNEIAFGDFGIQALAPAYVTNRQIEAARIAMTRYIKRGGRVWITIFPDRPLTKKPLGTRMGSGKGTPEFWIANVLKKSKEELFNLRFQSATGQLENTARLKAVKHDIARMYTILRERELGISQAPEATETKAEEK